MMGKVCLRVMFTGVKNNHKKGFCAAIGDYVEAYEGTTNTALARSSACIELYDNTCKKKNIYND